MSLDDSSATLGETTEIPQRHEIVSRWVAELQDDAGMRRVDLDDMPRVFGTSRTSEVRVHDPAVSARHCELTVVGEFVRVRDLGSRNGTYMSGARVEIGRALAGEVIHVGRSSIALKAAGPESVTKVEEPLPGVIGGSLAMRRLAGFVRRFAPMNVPVLVLGESGSGKELIARAIHAESKRKADAFVAVNVAGVPRELMETEMFGHERGAFTGAVQRHRGAFAESEGGTLFLDEIGDLPVEAQPKLLRALDGYEVKAVGQEGRGRRFDVRVVAATNAALLDKVNAGTFRRDLYHRLEAIVVRIPALRARRGDLIQLVPALLAGMSLPRGVPEVQAEALSLLTTHDWPGNVRQLKNVLSRAVVESDGGVIDAAAVRRAINQSDDEDSFAATELTAQAARGLLARHHGNISRAAREAGMARTSFRRLLGPDSTGADTVPGPPPSETNVTTRFSR